MAEPWVGIIANPVSARDIRRVIANAASLQITDRANIVLRVLACLKACGVAAGDDDAGDRRHPRPCEARPRPLGQSAARWNSPSSPSSTCGSPARWRTAGAPRRPCARAGRFGHRRAGRRRHPSRRGLGLREGAAGRHLDRHQQRLSRASRADGDGARRRPCRHRPHPGRRSPSSPTSASSFPSMKGRSRRSRSSMSPS